MIKEMSEDNVVQIFTNNVGTCNRAGASFASDLEYNHILLIPCVAQCLIDSRYATLKRRLTCIFFVFIHGLKNTSKLPETSKVVSAIKMMSSVSYAKFECKYLFSRFKLKLSHHI